MEKSEAQPHQQIWKLQPLRSLRCFFQKQFQGNSKEEIQSDGM